MRSLPFVILSAISLVACGQLRPQAELSSRQSEEDFKLAVDTSVRPRLLASETLVLKRQSGQNEKETSPIFADSLSMILLLENRNDGILALINSGANENETRLALSSGELQIRRTSSVGNISSSSLSLPSELNFHVVALRFGTQADDYEILLNGAPVNLEKNSSGSPGSYQYLLKDAVFATPAAGLNEIYLFTAKLADYELNSLARLIDETRGLGQTAFVANLVPGIGVPKEVLRPEFVAARDVLNRSCVSCHNGGTAPSFLNMTEAQFLSRSTADGGKLAVKGSLAASALYYRLVTATRGPGPRNMSISGSETQILETWINSIP